MKEAAAVRDVMDMRVGSSSAERLNITTGARHSTRLQNGAAAAVLFCCERSTCLSEGGSSGPLTR